MSQLVDSNQPSQRPSKGKTSSAPVWQIQDVSEDLCQSISSEFGFLPETARLLVNRGLTNSSDIQSFLEPSLKQLIPPTDMHGIREAVDRLIIAISNKQKVMIHGDYDADGVTSTALLYRFLREVGLQALVYIPDRLTENHGINEGAIDEARQKGVKLFMTCDCGVSSAAQVNRLVELGIDVLITDHHLIPQDGTPKNAIVVNPSQDKCFFGDEEMTGVGIAYYLMIALRTALRERRYFSAHVPEPNLKSYLDLVTLGTIADQAPLIGQNRIFVTHGLPELTTTKKMGLQVLMNLCIPADRQVTVQDIAFFIAPKLNAAGRMGKAHEAFELLVEDDPIRAAVLARKLMNYNDERKDIEAGVMREADFQAEQLMHQQETHFLTLYHPNWHLGVLGIVAQRLVEKYAKPAILLTKQGDRLKGSGRSIEGLHLVDTIASAREYLISFGGHSMAAGLALDENALSKVRERFNQTAAEVFAKQQSDRKAVTKVDAELSLAAINERLILEIAKLAPFGAGNPQPVFVCNGISVKQARQIGRKKEHLRLLLADDKGTSVSAIAFRQADYAKVADRQWRVLLTPEFNWWQGKRSIQARIQAIQFK